MSTFGKTTGAQRAPGGDAGGDLTGTYPNPTVATVNGVPVANRDTVQPSGGVTVILTQADASKTLLFDTALGIAYTLPAPVVGTRFRFLVTALQTAGANVVVTNAGTVFLTGALTMFSGENITPSATLGPKLFAGDGSTHIKTTTNGTTTGGGIGSWMEFICISATLWYVYGNVKSPSGTLATPFST